MLYKPHEMPESLESIENTLYPTILMYMMNDLDPALIIVSKKYLKWLTGCSCIPLKNNS